MCILHFVPLIMKLTAALGRAGERRRELVSLVDILPALAAALDLPLDLDDQEQLEGVDVLAQGGGRTAVFSERTLCEAERLGPGEQYALITAEWKYLLSSAGGDALFDMAKDPSERLNVIVQHPQVAAEMKRLSEALLQEADRKAAGFQKRDGIDPELEQQLKGLGY